MNLSRNNKIIRLGITGGIGGGKSTVCKVFAVLGIPIFYSDAEASKIMNTDESLMSAINSVVGEDMYLSGSLDRALLAKYVYNDENLLQQINQLVHPAVFENFVSWSNTQDAPYAIVEAAILFESGMYKYVDKVATVTAPVEERIDRVITRNGKTREQVLQIMKNQMDDETKIKMSDYVINNSEKDMVIPVVLKIHEDLINHLER